MDSGSRRLFIYYRLDERSLAQSTRAARGAHQELASRHPGLNCELLWAPAPSARGERTVMETYTLDAHVNPHGIDTALQRDIEEALCHALGPWLAASDRHLEVFMAPTCAS